MEIAALAETLVIAATESLGFAKSSTGILQISTVVSPIDAVAPPAVRSNRHRVSRRKLERRRRTRRISFDGNQDDSGGGGEDCWFFGGGDGPFGGGGGSGRGWNFGGFGGSDWDESSPSSSSGFASDFLHEVIAWIALSNCVHFAFKRVLRLVGDGIGDDSKEKIPMRLSTEC